MSRCSWTGPAQDLGHEGWGLPIQTPDHISHSSYSSMVGTFTEERQLFKCPILAQFLAKKIDFFI